MLDRRRVKIFAQKQKNGNSDPKAQEKQEFLPEEIGWVYVCLTKYSFLPMVDAILILSVTGPFFGLMHSTKRKLRRKVNLVRQGPGRSLIEPMESQVSRYL